MHTIAVAPNRKLPYRPGPCGPVLMFVAIALLVVGATVGVGTGGSLTAPGPAPPGAMAPAAQRSYVVQPGDTLWSVARGLRPTGDVRPLVGHLSRQTGGKTLRVGQRIALP